MKTIYLKDKDGETQKIKFFELDNKKEILDSLVQDYQNALGVLKYDIVQDEQGDILYEDGCRYY